VKVCDKDGARLKVINQQYPSIAVDIDADSILNDKKH
jgi:hypothetical protein